MLGLALGELSLLGLCAVRITGRVGAGVVAEATPDMRGRHDGRAPIEGCLAVHGIAAIPAWPVERAEVHLAPLLVVARAPIRLYSSTPEGVQGADERTLSSTPKLVHLGWWGRAGGALCGCRCEL